MIISIAEARAQCRVGGSYPEDQLTPYIEAASDIVKAHLNRAVFPDKDALNTALDAVPDTLAQAQADYEAAVEAANSEPDRTKRRAMLAVAEAKLTKANDEARAVLNGIVVNPSIKSAALLTVGHLFSNREDVVIGATAVQLPMGAHALLRPYRLVMMP